MPNFPSSSTVTRHKFFLRNLFKKRVLELTRSARQRDAKRIAKLLAGLTVFRRARSVGAYLSLPHEVDTTPILRLCRALEKRVSAPAIDPKTNKIRFVALPRSSRGLKKNIYGILEPELNSEGEIFPDILVVPGRAFTISGERLGSGGGSYDRYLARHPNIPTVALAFEEQICARIPTDRHDRQMTVIVTPKRVLRRH